LKLWKGYRGGKSGEFRIDLLFMSPYSPELNPMERVWKFIRKRATHNKYFALLDDLRAALLQQSNLYSRPNETFRKLCPVNYS